MKRGPDSVMEYLHSSRDVRLAKSGKEIPRVLFYVIITGKHMFSYPFT